MTRAYLRLFAAALAVALVLAIVARMPHRADARPAPAVAPAPLHAVEVVIEHGAVSPDPVLVPKGARVRLTVRNAGDRPVRLQLAGYGPGVSTDAIAASASWHTEFIADRPGEDFVFLVDGAPAGRFGVTGSHLVEGHR